jgi:uncharacterized OsmC-like protein
MQATQDTAANDVQVNERLQSIFVKTEYLGAYQSVNHVRDLPDIYLDEPLELGGKNTGPTPLEMGLCSLNSCTAMVMNIMRREMRFDIQAVRMEAEGIHDVRRAEMKRTGKLFSEVEPVAYHYHNIIQKIWIKTSESDERLEKFSSEVERLCPLHALLRDARVNLEAQWIKE